MQQTAGIFVLEFKNWGTFVVCLAATHESMFFTPRITLCSFLYYTYLISSSLYSRSNVAEPSIRQQRRSHQHQPPPPQPAVTSTNIQSVQVLNYEASLLQQQVCRNIFKISFYYEFIHVQIEQFQDRLSPDQLHQLQMKLRAIEEQSERLVDTLRRGGKQAIQGIYNH